MKSAIRTFVFALLCVTAVWQASSAGTTTYKYDALGRIATATDGAAVIHYIYDAAGNREEKQAQTGAAAAIALSTTAIQRQGSVVYTATTHGATPPLNINLKVFTRRDIQHLLYLLDRKMQVQSNSSQGG